MGCVEGAGGPEKRATGNYRGALKGTSGASLFVDEPVPFALLSVLEKGGHGHDQENLNADHTEHSSEDIVHEGVSEWADRRNTSLLEGRGRRARAGSVRDEGGGGAVEITAATELEMS